jgi:hypothetical protein
VFVSVSVSVCHLNSLNVWGPSGLDLFWSSL